MQLMARSRGQRNPGKAEPSLTVQNPHLSNVRLVPASTLSQDQVVASWSSCLSIHDLQALHHDSKMLLVLSRDWNPSLKKNRPRLEERRRDDVTGTPLQNHRPRVEERRRDDVTGTPLQNRRPRVEERRRDDVTGTPAPRSSTKC